MAECEVKCAPARMATKIVFYNCLGGGVYRFVATAGTRDLAKGCARRRDGTGSVPGELYVPQEVARHTPSGDQFHRGLQRQVRANIFDDTYFCNFFLIFRHGEGNYVSRILPHFPVFSFILKTFEIRSTLFFCVNQPVSNIPGFRLYFSFYF